MATLEFRIDGNTGQMGIVNYSNRDNAFNNPLNNLNDVYFHTALPYLQIRQTISPMNITFSYIQKAQYTWSNSGCGC